MLLIVNLFSNNNFSDILKVILLVLQLCLFGLKELAHAHVGLLDLLLVDRLLIALFDVSLDGFLHGLDLILRLEVEAEKLHLNLVQHDETDDQDFWHHVQDQPWDAVVVVQADFQVS